MRAFKIGILIASALVISVLSFVSADSPDPLFADNSLCECSAVQSSQYTSKQCLKVKQDSSWFSWLTGNSRSAQFHYLDLLELLSSSEDSKKATTFSF